MNIPTLLDFYIILKYALNSLIDYRNRTLVYKTKAVIRI